MNTQDKILITSGERPLVYQSELNNELRPDVELEVSSEVHSITGSNYLSVMRSMVLTAKYIGDKPISQEILAQEKYISPTDEAGVYDTPQFKPLKRRDILNSCLGVLILVIGLFGLPTGLVVCESKANNSNLCYIFPILGIIVFLGGCIFVYVWRFKKDRQLIEIIFDVNHDRARQSLEKLFNKANKEVERRERILNNFIALLKSASKGSTSAI